MGMVTKSVDELANTITRIRGEIINKIENLPDNPRITRLSKNAYTMKSGDLGNSWSAEYHDFKYTYNMINKWIEGMQFENIVPNLEQALVKGSFTYNKQKFYLHPDIVNHLRSIL